MKYLTPRKPSINIFQIVNSPNRSLDSRIQMEGLRVFVLRSPGQTNEPASAGLCLDVTKWGYFVVVIFYFCFIIKACFNKPRHVLPKLKEMRKFPHLS